MEENRIPLAERMRPKTFEDFYGQQHIIGKNMLLRRAIEANKLGSCIFFGPPGTGKTTLANVIANTAKGEFKKLNAVSSGVAEAKQIIEQARTNKQMFGTQTYLLLDECHRWSKAQSDCVLSAVEDGSIIFIGSTTENPFVSMTRAIVSRCRIFEFEPLTNKDIISALKKAIKDKNNGYGNLDINITDDACEHFAWASSGDLRMAFNALELAVQTTSMDKNGTININKEVSEQSIQKKSMSIDENGFYDFLSAFCKSIRGSDADASLYYMQRLVQAGCDPQIIARRLIAHCSEDIGLADSNALLLAISALYSVKNLGIPECLLTLSHAIIYACEAEKSNSVVNAMKMAEEDARNVRDDNVPYYLKNHPSTNDKEKKKYKYPHNYGGYVDQQYLPNKLKDRIYYIPSKNGKEKNILRKKLMNKNTENNG